MRRLGGQHEQRLQPGLLRLFGDGVENFLAAAVVPVIRVGGHTGELAAAVFLRIQRAARDDHAFAFDDGELLDLGFQQFTGAFNENASRFQRLDQFDDAADVVDSGIPQLLVLFLGDKGAAAVAGEEFGEQGAVIDIGNHLCAFDAGLARLHAELEVEQLHVQALVGDLGLDQRFRFLGIELVDGVAVLVEDAGLFRIDQQLVRLQCNGDAGGDFFHRQVEYLAGG